MSNRSSSAILQSNKFDIKGRGINKNNLEYELNQFVIQQPNKRWIGIPREWIYWATKDTATRFTRYIHKNIAEKPSIFDSLSTAESQSRMTTFLRNKKGYYNASVESKVDKVNKDVNVTYKIKLGKRAKVASIKYLSEDKTLLKVLHSVNKSKKKLQIGDPIDEATFQTELNRITLELQDRGYARFAANYIKTYGDSLNHPEAVDVIFEILPPLPDSSHVSYSIGDVNVYPDHIQDIDLPLKEDTEKGMNVFSLAEKPLMNHGLLRNNIFLNSGEVYSRTKRNDTYRKLSALGVYKFVNITSKVNPNKPDVLDFDVILSPYKNKWISDVGADLFYAILNQQRNQLLGFSFNSQLINRNLLGGAERFTINARVGTELSLQSPFGLRSQNYGLDTELQIPRYIKLNPWSGLLDRFSNSIIKHRKFTEEAFTNIGIGFNHIDLNNYYSISNISAELNYRYRPHPQYTLLWKQTGFEYNRYIIRENFSPIIEGNPLLKQSFQNNLMTGFLFNDLLVVSRRGTERDATTDAFIGHMEVSGLEIHAANTLYNLATGKDNDWQFVDNINFAKFVKMDGEYRLYRNFRNGNSLASRLYVGAALPYGRNSAVPFVRQFSVGGPNSLRGWNQKELGPGSYDAREDYEGNNNPYYQQGDIRLEANVEFRFDLVWILEGALFTDAGNVWTVKETNEQIGGHFTSSFYNDLAVSAGYGIRMDITYFNIRFDFGYKLRYPYTVEGSKWVSWQGFKSQGLGNFQVAINYPF